MVDRREDFKGASGGSGGRDEDSRSDAFLLERRREDPHFFDADGGRGREFDPDGADFKGRGGVRGVGPFEDHGGGGGGFELHHLAPGGEVSGWDGDGGGGERRMKGRGGGGGAYCGRPSLSQ